MKKTIALIFLVLVALACSESGSNNSNSEIVQKDLVKAPGLNADSIYSFVQAQVDFGPRVPNSKAHRDAADYFVNKFKSYGAKVVVQEFEDQNYEGKTLKLRNIIASFNPGMKKRILLAAHWDTRQFADKDDENVYAKLDGANDGASGVGVLLEVARVISVNEGPNVGVDIILFDGEDGGEHENMASVDFTGGKESWWCLGSQYWSKNKHVGNYTAFYGVLLDMVGAKGATFYQDTISKRNAQRIVDKVWNNAEQLGYGKFFINKPGLELTDDHLFVNKYARIPMIDIIDMRGGTAFVPEHHTQNDTMDAIDKNTLKAVGEVVLSMLYNE
jgi:peptidase M28-like protein